jgi:hypothetical protein
MKKLGLCKISFLQALGLVSYCGLIGIVFWRGERWFGQVPNFLGPFLMLVILVTSALICGLLALGYPAFLYLKQNETNKAVKLVCYTAGWLIGFSLLIMLVVRLLKG